MIEGNLVLLTELRDEDSRLLFQWINSPEIVQFSAPYTPIHSPNHQAWFDAVTKATDKVIFAIRTVSEGNLIGMVQLIGIHPVHRSAELIIRIGDEAWRNQGRGSEAVELTTDFAFRHRNLQRVWLRVFADNSRAIRAYEKAGFKVEGTMIRACFIDGRWRDETIMAILRDAESAAL